LRDPKRALDIEGAFLLSSAAVTSSRPLLAALLLCSCAEAVSLDAGRTRDAAPSRDATPSLDASLSLDAAAPLDAAEPLDSGVALPDAEAAPDAARMGTEITLRVLVPANTPPADTIYVAGDFQGWDPRAASNALRRVEAGVHEITLAFMPGAPIAFKFTRGSWETVETGSRGEEIANRTYQVGASATLELEVASWHDIPPGTTTGDVRTTTVTGFLGGRRVWIYLPPNYRISNDRYSVLYMLDGQNVFDANESFSGEWEVDETLERLIPLREVKPIIVVAIDNGGGSRLDEYTPWRDEMFGAGGGAAAHLDAIANVLVPYIDAHYRTLTGPQNTGLSGSSLGGLMTLYATYARPDVFGKNAALSPSIWWSNRQILTFAEAAMKPASQVWMDMGTAESTGAITDLRAMRDVMVRQGFVLGVDLQVFEEKGGGHNEPAWARRFPDVLRFLFPGP
jgi:predicted alpha/beta superfamily hydrolase